MENAIDRQLTVGSLFSGIGGFDLGLERAGMRVIWQSEIDPYASAVLRRHWPAVPNLGDIRGISAGSVADATVNNVAWRRHFGADQRYAEQRAPIPEGRGVDVLCGGFPCQDISNAGKRAGIDGERSGLWSEFARLIGELRPRYAIMENVAALLGRGIERVLGDLSEIGYDAEWHCIPASAVGAPHRRDRVWVVAYPADDGLDAVRPAARLQAHRRSFARITLGTDTGRKFDWWIAEPDVGRVAHGVSSRVDRLRCLGNAIVPQIAEIIGRAIVSTA